MLKRIFAVLIALSAVVPLAAQQGRGTIHGTVTDSSGAVVPGAQITITNTGTNFVFNAETSAEGYYASPAIPIGGYTVTAGAQGFKTSVRSGITLQVDQHAQVNLVLQLGTLSDSVVVTGEATLVDTASGTLGKVVENRPIQELPVNGRSAFALVLLAPAVRSVVPNNQGFIDRGSVLSQVTINGSPAATNSIVVDGANNNQTYYNELNANPAVDAIQEFKVQSNTMSAEFGFTLGGVVNVVSKAGTNQYHGTVYEFIRNSAFDARDTFKPSKSQFQYNQPGGSLGGPIRLPKLYNGKDRTFFFFNYEQYMYRTSASAFTTVPIAAWKAGDFSNLRDSSGSFITIYDPSTTQPNTKGSGYTRLPFANNIIPRNQQDPVALAAQKLYPDPNAIPVNQYNQTNNFYQVNRNATDSNQWTSRIDHHISDRHQIFGRLMYFEHNPYPLATNYIPLDASGARRDDAQNKNFILSDVYTISPRWINEFKGGITRQHLTFKVSSADHNWPSQLGLPGVPDDVFPLLNNNFAGLNSQGTYGTRASTTLQFADSVSALLGAHTLRMGVDFRRLMGDNFQKALPSGQFNMTGGLTSNPQSPTGTGFGYAQFLTGAVSDASISTHIGESERGYSLSGFVQDDWKVSRRLTLNLGLRYDYQAPIHEMHNGYSNFDPLGTNPLTGLKGRVTYAGVDAPSSPFGAQKKNFGPRVGFSYDLAGNGKTVVRGGYGIFYAAAFNITYFGNTNGFSSTFTNYLAPSGNNNYPALYLRNGLPYAPTNPLGSKLGPSFLLGGSGATYDQQGEPVPMSQQWNLSVQHQLPHGIVLEANYTANRGNHLVAGGYDMNQMDPQYNSLGLSLQDMVANPYAGKIPGTLGGAKITRKQSLMPYPYYAGIGVRNPHLGNSMYHALLVSAEKRFASGFSFMASFTGGKLMSDSVIDPLNNLISGDQTGVTGYQNGGFARNAERSLDPTDVSRRLVLSGIYELPFGKGKRFLNQGGAIDRVFGGWQVNTSSSFQNGVPLVVRGASNFLADRPNSTGQSARLDNPTMYQWLNGNVFVNPPDFTYGNVGRVLPDVRAPGIVSVDLSVAKNINIGEHARLQFRAEAFNAPNWTNLGLPNTSFTSRSKVGPNGEAIGTNSNALFGRITYDRGPRNMQLGLKLVF